jgi:hypothetical protein
MDDAPEPHNPKQAVRTKRLQIELATEMLVEIENFRFSTRMPSLSAAVRELLKRGLLQR